MWRALDVTTSVLVTVVRLGAGLVAGRVGERPAEPLTLYDFEACPFCREVRESLSVLDLEARILPCPRRGTRFRADLVRLGGRERVPYLVDPNTGRALYESRAIVRYLFETYGAGSVPVLSALAPILRPSAAPVFLLRPGRGRRARASRPPAEPLELWSFEGSPYCRIVRERLCELELPYLLHNVAKRSENRASFVARSGKMMVPYLVDPNTGAEMFESADIVSYLERTYAD